MNGLFLRNIFLFGLLFSVLLLCFLGRTSSQAEENTYRAIKQRGTLMVGTVHNPVSYFVGEEGQSGLEYELSKAFADYLGVELEILEKDNNEQLFSALKANQIDIAAANLLFQADKMAEFHIGPTYNSASWQLVYRKGETRPRSLQDLNGKLVITGGSEFVPLLESAKEKMPLEWETVHHQNQESLLLQVAEGKIDYTIANSMDVLAAQQIKPQLAVAFDLTDEASVHWYLSNKADHELQAALLDFMSKSLEEGVLARLEEKYINHFAEFDYVDMRAYTKAIETTLPKYQPLFEQYQGELDWRLLAAVAYQESHWNPDATSPTGVRGMMMLTKDTAARMKIKDRTDPEQSIKAGAEYLHWLISQVPDSVPQEDRIWYALIGYNMGLGHMLDARQLTRLLGENPDNWLDVKNNLPRLANKKYYHQLKYGYARGYEAFQYVENIRRYMNSIVNYHRVQQNQEQFIE